MEEKSGYFAALNLSPPLPNSPPLPLPPLLLKNEKGIEKKKYFSKKKHILVWADTTMSRRLSKSWKGFYGRWVVILLQIKLSERKSHVKANSLMIKICLFKLFWKKMYILQGDFFVTYTRLTWGKAKLFFCQKKTFFVKKKAVQTVRFKKRNFVHK